MSASLPGVIEPFCFLLKFRIRRTHCVRFDGFRHRQLLFGKPAFGILAVEGGARDCGVDA